METLPKFRLQLYCRRGDLETLGYNLVHWTSGFLPWRDTEDPEAVQTQKNGFLGNIDTFLKKVCLGISFVF